MHSTVLDSLLEQEVVETGLGRTFEHARTATPVDAENPAGGIGAVEVERFAIQVQGVMLQLRLEHLVGEGETQLEQVTQQAGGEHSSAAVAATRTWACETTRLEYAHLELQVVLPAQLQQVQGSETTSWSTTHNGHTVMIFQAILCQDCLRERSTIANREL